MQEDIKKLERMINNNSNYEDILKQSKLIDTYIEDKIREAL